MRMSLLRIPILTAQGSLETRPWPSPGFGIGRASCILSPPRNSRCTVTRESLSRTLLIGRLGIEEESMRPRQRSLVPADTCRPENCCARFLFAPGLREGVWSCGSPGLLPPILGPTACITPLTYRSSKVLLLLRSS